MKIKLLILVTVAALSGCTMGDGSNITEYPEARTHIECLSKKSYEYAKEQGGPLELGIAVAAACTPTRVAFEKAVRKDTRRPIADGIFSNMEASDARSAAAKIVEYRRRG